MSGLIRKCPCVRPEETEVRVLDYRHCSLDHLPGEVFNHERTLEELYVDANQLRDLPRELFYCHGLHKLTLSDNELTCIPPAIASLINLQELDISKNGIVDLPDNIKCCKHMRNVEASVNPLGKLPEGFTQLLNLTQLFLNDTFLDYLPGNFGRLSKLKILEVRENHLKTLPRSMSRLTELERLDIGNNEFTELPEVVGSLTSLLELWCDANQITHLPQPMTQQWCFTMIIRLVTQRLNYQCFPYFLRLRSAMVNFHAPLSIGNLKSLMFLDGSKNRIEWLPQEIEGCLSLADLHLSTNLLQQLPESIGRLSNLTTLKVDDNRLTSLPFSIGGLVSLSELNVGANDLEEIPPSIGLLRHLRTLYADENFIQEIPAELGSCNGITVLSVRSNNLTYIPDEIGRIPRLRVLNLSDNKIRCLPFSLTKLKELQALWLAENQSTPLIRLQTDIDIDTGQRMLTCYLLPQQHSDDRDDMYSDGDSFHPSLWEEERKGRQRIHFDFEELTDEEGKLERCPTPYPKEMKNRITQMRNLAMKQLNLPNGEARRDNVPIETRSQGCRTEPVLGRGRSSEQVMVTPVGQPPGSPIGSARGDRSPSKPTSPLLGERHLLLRADKEKTAKDKARMQQRHQSPSGDDVPGSPKMSPKSSEKKAKDKSSSKDKSSMKDKSPTKSKKTDDDDGGFLTVSNRRGPRASPAAQHKPLSPDKQYPSDINHSTSNPSLSSHLGRSPGGFNYLAGPKNVPPPPKSHTMSEISSWQDPGYRSHAHHFDNPHHGRGRSGHSSRHARSRGYESDTGYRSDGGYRSDTGYRSDYELYRSRHRHATPRTDGYASDWEAAVNRQLSNQYLSRGGGYSSDMELYSGRSRNQHNAFRPITFHGNISQYEKPGSSGNSASRQANQGYTNAPLSKRTTIRNDEMYEQNSEQNQRQSRPVLVGANRRNHLPNVQESSKEKGEKKPVPPSANQTPSFNQGRTSQSMQNIPTPGRESMQPMAQQDTKNGANDRGGFMDGQDGDGGDDDAWKAQLYKASVKLQKTPSDKMRQLQGSPHSGSASPRDGSQVGQPPPYQPAPPYSPTHLAKVNNLTSQQDSHQEPYTEHRPPPAVPDSPRSQGSNRGFGVERRPSRTEEISRLDRSFDILDSPRSNGQAGLSSSTQHLQMDSPRGKDLYQNQRPVSGNGQIPSNQALYPDQRSEVQRSQDNLYQNERPNSFDRFNGDRPQDQFRNCRYGDAEAPGGSSDGQFVQGDHAADTSFSRMQGQSTPTGHTGQFDRDVAMYKLEPPSQVSSSTDSGYGHAHIYERLHDSNSSSPGVPPNPTFPSPIQSSPSPPVGGARAVPFMTPPLRDPPSAPYSREGTPGRSLDMGPGDNIAGPTYSNSPRTPAVFHVTVHKNPGLGFSIAGGLGSQGNPFRSDDNGIFITKVQQDGPASVSLKSGDKILEVNGVDFTQVDHNQAVTVLRNSGQMVAMLVERLQ